MKRALLLILLLYLAGFVTTLNAATIELVWQASAPDQLIYPPTPADIAAGHVPIQVEIRDRTVFFYDWQGNMTRRIDLAAHETATICDQFVVINNRLIKFDGTDFLERSMTDIISSPDRSRVLIDDGTAVEVPGDPWTINFYIDTGQLLTSHEVTAGKGDYLFTPSSQYLLALLDGEGPILFDRNGKEIWQSLFSTSCAILADEPIAFSPDEQFVAINWFDGKTRTYHNSVLTIQTGQRLWEHEGRGSIIYGGDGKLLLQFPGGNDYGMINVLNAQTGQLQRQIDLKNKLPEDAPVIGKLFTLGPNWLIAVSGHYGDAGADSPLYDDDIPTYIFTVRLDTGSAEYIHLNKPLAENYFQLLKFPIIWNPADHLLTVYVGRVAHVFRIAWIRRIIITKQGGWSCSNK